MQNLVVVVAASLAVLLTGSANAQTRVNRIPLQTVDFPDKYSTIAGVAEVSPGGTTGRHNHPGIEIGYVIDGEMILIVDGKGEQHFKAGESWQIAATVPHEAKNTSDKLAKVLVTYVVEKGKPVASPVQ
jgi:quercetin dioxygenase-like cupin family protein